MDVNSYKDGGITYSNYNFSYILFSQKYFELCQDISETMNLQSVQKKIITFLNSYGSATGEFKKFYEYYNRFRKLSFEVEQDKEFHYIMSKEELSFKEEVRFYPKYYDFFIRYLNILSEFVSTLSKTYIPKLKNQQQMVRFKNDDPFIAKMHEYKSLVLAELGEFSITKFRKQYNYFITYIYAYKPFISDFHFEEITKSLSYVLSLFISEDTINLLSFYPDFSYEQKKKVHLIESHLHLGIVYSEYLTSCSLSDRGLTPNLIKRVEADYSLI